jgi:DNA-binding transcriptional LysR family regulator
VELRVVKYFLAVADAGSITEGARRVHISQPAISRQLRALEAELGVDLFERGHGALRLTHAGTRFAGHARDLVRREQLLHLALRSDDPTAMKLLATAPFATMHRVLAPFTAAHGHEHPVVDAIEAEPVGAYAHAVAIGADLALSSAPPPAGWASRRLSAVGIAAHVAPGHPLYGRESVDMPELVTHRLILLDRTNSARIVFDDALAIGDLTVDDPIEMSSSLISQGLAAAGRGAAVLTNEAQFGLHPVPIMQAGRQVQMTMYAGWDATHYAAPVIDRWVMALSEWTIRMPEVERVEWAERRREASSATADGRMVR